MAQLRADVEAKVRPMLATQPEPPDPRLADLSEADRDLLAQREQEHAAALEELELRNQLLQIKQERPREAAIIERLLRAESLADMAEAISAAFGEPDPEAQVADVDRNNPPASPLTYGSVADMIQLPDGRLLTREEGLEILRGAQSLHG